MTLKAHSGVATGSLLASTLQILVDSGYLEVREVGKLAQTSHEINAASMAEDVWVSLCGTRVWPNKASFLRSVVESKGHRWLYHQWSCPVLGQSRDRNPPSLGLLLCGRLWPSRASHRRSVAESRGRRWLKRQWKSFVAKQRPLPPPSCTEDQICFSVNVSYKGTSIVSRVINRRQTTQLLRNGKILGRSGPIVLGEAEWDCTELEWSIIQRMREMEAWALESEFAAPELVPSWPEPVTCKDVDLQNIDVRIHMLRSVDSAMCCVFRSKCIDAFVNLPQVHPIVEEGQKVSRQSEFDFSKAYKKGSIVFGSFRDDTPQLRCSPLAKKINSRFCEPWTFYCSLGLGFLKPGVIAITSMNLAVAFQEPGSSSAIFVSHEQEQQHGVSLLHILSELQGNDFP